MPVETDLLISENDDILTTLEAYAHEHRALVSSDALRYFVAMTPTSDILAAFAETLTHVHELYPSEDGWAIVNLERMQSVVGTDAHSEAYEEPIAPERTPVTLAEAIIVGNITAAYEGIAHRPMIALAEATTDLDAVYRARFDETVTVNRSLVAKTALLSTEKLKAVVEALTSALDGGHPDEHTAVKLALMKAVKELK